MWPMISGENGTSPRHQIVAGSNVGGDEQGRTSAATAVGALIRPPWKIILGEGPGDILDMAGWPGPCVAPRLLLLLRGADSPRGAGCSVSPNATSVNYRNLTQVCGRTAATGCLYDVFADESERHNVAAANPAIFNEMLAAVNELQQGVFSPDRGTDDGTACAQAAGPNGGFWGPYLP